MIEKVFDNCVICQTWFPVKKGSDGNNYCSQHFPKWTSSEQATNKKRAGNAIKWLAFFRRAIESNPV